LVRCRQVTPIFSTVSLATTRSLARVGTIRSTAAKEMTILKGTPVTTPWRAEMVKTTFWAMIRKRPVQEAMIYWMVEKAATAFSEWRATIRSSAAKGTIPSRATIPTRRILAVTMF